MKSCQEVLGNHLQNNEQEIESGSWALYKTSKGPPDQSLLIRFYVTLTLFFHSVINNETFQVLHEGNNVHRVALITQQHCQGNIWIVLWFFGSLCCLFLGVLPIRFDHKKKWKCLVYPHFTIRAQRQVLWVTLPNEHHYSGSISQVLAPVFCEPTVQSNPVAFLRCSTFPCSLPKQAYWLTTQTTRA